MSNRRRSIAGFLLLSALAQTGCATTGAGDAASGDEEMTTGAPDAQPKREPSPEPQRPPSAAETGTATWYGPGLEGSTTASGERFSPQALTAAHKTLPFGTRVRVTALDTLASVVVTINDRLPAASRHVIDLSHAAGRMLKMLRQGIARVRVEVLE